jgi:transcriptional regulator with XRE-family HTH domain
MNLLNREKITALRQKKGWDQYELAQAANIAPSVISLLERGQRTDFRLSVVIGIADALGVRVNEILATQPELDDLPPSLIPELQAVVTKLAAQPDAIQRQAAGILNGYLSTLE